MMDTDTKSSAQKRLRRAEGALQGIGRMIDDNRYCIDIVRQIQAVKGALSGLENLVLRDHLATCVEQALTGDDIDERRQKVEELVSVLSGTKK